MTTIQRRARTPERRSMTMRGVEVRAAADGSGSAGTIEGYAIVYGSVSDDLGGWREIIMPGACTDLLASNPDVRMPYLDHEGLPIGRTTAGTLRLAEDEHGVRFSVDTPDTPSCRELITAVERGDVTQCSFRFVLDLEDREWVYPEDDLPLRQINRIDELWDVCLVTFPAYPATSADVRYLAGGEAPEEIPADPRALAHVDLRRRQLRLERRAA